MKIEDITGTNYLKQSIMENSQKHVDTATGKNKGTQLEEMREQAVDPTRGSVFDKEA